MKVYLLWEHYSNGVDCWKNLRGVYANEHAAELEMIRLECQHIDLGSGEERCWYVDEFKVIG